jgi:hypothetical protein
MKKCRRLIRLAAALAVGIVLLLPLSADALTSALRPNAAGDEALLTPVGAAANWDAVDEVTADEGTTYVASANSQTYSTDLYNIPDVTASGRGKINSVTVYFRARAEATPSQVSAYTRIKTNAVAYDGTAVTLLTTYADYSTSYTTNPQTTAEWTWLEINNLQIGVGLRRAKGGSLSLATQVWVVVDYTAASLESYREAGGPPSPIWGTVTNPYDGTYQTAYMYGTNYIKSHGYTVRYYDASGVQVTSEILSSSATNTFGSERTLNFDPNADAGTWHAVVFDNDFSTTADTYADRLTASGYMVADDFEVLAAAIPEIPTVIAGIAVAGACFAIYWWMRKRRLKHVQA